MVFWSGLLTEKRLQPSRQAAHNIEHVFQNHQHRVFSSKSSALSIVLKTTHFFQIINIEFSSKSSDFLEEASLAASF